MVNRTLFYKVQRFLILVHTDIGEWNRNTTVGLFVTALIDRKTVAICQFIPRIDVDAMY